MTDPHARICSVESSHIADLIRIGDDTNLSPWSAQSYLAELKNPNAIMLRLVSDDNETIGFVVGRVVTGGETEIRTDAEIYNIAVTRNYQSTGNGQALLAAFIEQSWKRGVKYIWLEVRESNQKALDFYTRNGFVHVQTRANFYDHPREAALLMRLKLDREKS